MGANRGEAIEWLRSAVQTDTDECLVWPFSVSNKGYGTVKYEGKLMRTHQVALLLVGRPLPEPPRVCRHTCHQPRCVNPRHIREGSQAENIADRLGHSVPLTAEDVRAIRSSDGTQQSVADRFGISRVTVSNIRSGKRWAVIAD